MKSAENVFDRKYSSFSTLATGVVDWDAILEDVSWFNFSGIAPAVSAPAAAAFGKLQEKGDATQNSVEKVQQILLQNS
jgi:2-dehydro-3-deoxygluconokinase